MPIYWPDKEAMRSLVSILIPAYNAEEWIAETLQSAIAQTWPTKEIIVVDDGSCDNTLEVCQRFEAKGVRVVSQQNGGASGARNRALSLSQGDYVQWLDADDLLAPDKVARQMEAIEGSRDRRTLLSGPWGRFLYRQDRAQFTPTELWSDLSPSEWLELKLGQNLHMQTATWLVSREMTEAAGPWDETLSVDDDGEYFCRVLLQSDGVRFVPDAKVFYRASGSQSVSCINQSDQKREDQWRSMQLHIGYLHSLRETEATRAASVRYLQNWLIHFYPERMDLVREMQAWARELGGELHDPHLSWKYCWIRVLFGWSAAKQAQLHLPLLRWSLARYRDKGLT